MNIAQALRKQSELRARINTLENRIRSDFLVVEPGKVGYHEPTYADKDFKEMLAELECIRKRATELKNQIDAANHIIAAKNTIKDGYSVFSLLADRNEASAKLNFLTNLRQSQPDMYRAGVDEKTKFVHRISDIELDKQIDELTAKIRQIDDNICQPHKPVLYQNQLVQFLGQAPSPRKKSSKR